MKGINTVNRKNGTSVCITYTPPGQARVRDIVEFVPAGREFTRRLREARKRAEMVLCKRRAAIVEGQHQLAPRRTMTLSGFVDKYYADELRQRRGGGLRTAEKEIQRLTTGPVGKEFGSTPISGLTEWRIQKYIRARRVAGIGPGAINRDLARLSNLWRSAHKRKLVRGDNPLKDVDRLDEPRHRERFLEPDQEKKLLAELHPDIRRLAEVAIHAGIRLGALLGLRWRDVDLGRETIEVPDHLSKNRESYTVPINSRVGAILKELRSRANHIGSDDLIFCKGDGSPRKSVRTAWKAACKRAGLNGVRFHDLRHTAASRIVMAGGTLYDVQEHLGHKTAAMAQRYAHLSADHRRRVAELTLANSVTYLSRVRAEREAESA